ncbi:hypothetical protein P8Q88_01710 [Qipengyuania sp. XHP0207]|uniref:hypothetical protein n=1 Tax=Qipengyuania sp. XHP0207 TaxID=3038078 RepID=UPI00241EE858|nr:hypothetical protein [Qipengyuania sp. XHP0207]MDG5746881.1 hypothetical protein [Qipengyuania sp. XHP0207]
MDRDHTDDLDDQDRRSATASMMKHDTGGASEQPTIIGEQKTARHDAGYSSLPRMRDRHALPSPAASRLPAWRPRSYRGVPHTGPGASGDNL